ncbi:MAG: HIT family protein [Alphaproteobacteria bacterium]|nr:HIT family protein [Alphaproteobacteria bacterium]
MNNDCIFCKIIHKKSPGHIVHEDALCTAFLPLKPINPGHVLVASQQHYDSFLDMPNDVALHITQTAREIGQRINKAYKPVKVGFSIVGFEVSHVHIHVVPLYKKYEITSSTYASIKNGRIAWTDESMHACSQDEQRDILARLQPQ